MNRTRRITANSLLLSFSSVLTAFGCSESVTPGGTGGLVGETGGAAQGAGGTSSGGTNSTGGAPASGGTNAGTGGTASTGGTNAGTGGTASTGGTNAGTGGTEATGGTNAGTGGGSNGTPVFHIFMLMGQSNMAGVAKFQDSDKNTDERLLVWGGGGGKPQNQWNLANPPLHDPGGKGWNAQDAVGPGMWFGKTLLEKLPAGHTIGLVGVSESGQSINTMVSGGEYHNLIMGKIAAVKDAENAHFEGIIFHQGESDSGNAGWPAKVVQLYDEVKDAFGVDYEVPMILGELPAGGCCSGHNSLVHQAASQLPDGYWITQDGTGVLSDNLHFNHDSVVLMGKRYGEKMIEALGW